MKQQKKITLLGLVLMGAAVVVFYHRGLALPDRYPDEFDLQVFRATSNNAAIKNITNANVSLVIRLSSGRKQLKTQFYCMFLRTMVFFWPPSYGSLNIVLDKESKADQVWGVIFKKQLNSHFPTNALNVFYEALPRANILNFKGMRKPAHYNRQLYSTFFADNYTTDSIIAYMDTDVQFVAPITREYIGLTNNGKLRVLAEGTFHVCVKLWSKSTHVALGLPLPFNFMITFPQLLHRSTIENCRKHILKHTNTTDFQDAFAKFYTPGSIISPICIMLTYAWHYEYEKYDWHIKTKDVNINNRFLPANKKVNSSDTIPSVIGAAHVSQLKEWQPHIMSPGYCMATKAAGMNIPGCKDVKHDPNLICDYWESFFRYPWPTAKTWCKAGTMAACCNQAVDKHYQDVPKYYKQKLFKFDKEDVYKVEKMAKEEGVTCPHMELP